MHELSIAQNIIEIVSQEMKSRQLKCVDTIALRIGALTCISPDALEFGFQAATVDTPLESTKLAIERLPVIGKCLSCGCEFEVEEYVFICPECSSRNLDITQGKEVEIAYLEAT